MVFGALCLFLLKTWLSTLSDIKIVLPQLSSIEAGPERGILVQGIYWGSTLRSRVVREAGQGRAGKQ